MDAKLDEPAVQQAELQPFHQLAFPADGVERRLWVESGDLAFEACGITLLPPSGPRTGLMLGSRGKA
jgi:hypothetical protein